MARTIGIRGYKVTAYKKGDTTPIPFNSSEFNISPQEFLTNFATETTDVVQNDELERSWYFENIQKPNLGHIKGFIRYGTYGFESDFINNKTKKKIITVKQMMLKKFHCIMNFGVHHQRISHYWFFNLFKEGLASAKY